MSSITDLTMAINTTFGSILSQIQLSNLNFNIQMTPYAAYITLKKSVQTGLNGVLSNPSPPVLLLLQKVHQEHLAMQAETHELKVALEIIKDKIDALVRENLSLVQTIEEKNNAVEVMKVTNDNLQNRLDSIQREHSNCCTARASTESKIKGMKKKHSEEVSDLQMQVSNFNKALKAKDKVVNHLNNAPETIKTLKAEKSLLKTSKTKLEGEIRKLEKKLKTAVENKNICQSKFSVKDNTIRKNVDETKLKASDSNANYISAATSDPAIHRQIYSTMSPSMMSHWTPPFINTPQFHDSMQSMIAHCILMQPPPEEDKQLSKDDFLEFWAEHCAQIEKDWSEIRTKIVCPNKYYGE